MPNEYKGEKRGIQVTDEKKGSSIREVTKDWGYPSVQNKLSSA